MVLLIGYGNTLRRDDGAGVVLTEMFAQGARREVRAIVTQQLLPELAEEIAEPCVKMVIFCDAIQAAGPDDEPVRLKRLVSLPVVTTIGHQFSPETLMSLAERLYGAAPPSWLVTVTGHDFGYGEGLSEKVRSSLAVAEDTLRCLVAEITPAPATAP
ncbi:MAG: hydrogenase maturation protease [Desulfuromonadales bacterium]|nr:MAG: hydrogenase maturation protease [Desulfuromonadales bacterium]